MKISRRQFIDRAAVTGAGLSFVALADAGCKTPDAPSKMASLPRGSAVAPLTKIVFGSCNREFSEQPLWPHIAAEAPQVFIWGGDIIYGDRDAPAGGLRAAFRRGIHGSEKFDVPKHPKDRGIDPRLAFQQHAQALRDKYAVQKNRPEYRTFLASNPNLKIIGTWDDHDYGWDNEGIDFGADNSGRQVYPIKEASQAAFLDFLGEPPASIRRQQQGIYASYDYGPPGKVTRVILLDNRYHLNRKKQGAANTGLEDVLGAEQTAWFGDRISKGADVYVIVSGLQIMPKPNECLGKTYGEQWADYPRARVELFNKLFNSHAGKRSFFVSGDVHWGGLYRSSASQLATDGIDTTNAPEHFFEMTSSGLTHTLKRNDIWQLGVVKNIIERQGCLTDDDRIHELNYGVIRINWSADRPMVTLAVKAPSINYAALYENYSFFDTPTKSEAAQLRNDFFLAGAGDAVP